MSGGEIMDVAGRPDPNAPMSAASPVPRPLSVVLRDLTKVAVCILERPAVAFSFRERLDDVAGETIAWSKRMADASVIDITAIWLTQALRNVIDERGPVLGGPRDKWSELARIFLPHVERSRRAAAELEAHPSTGEGAGGGLAR